MISAEFVVCILDNTPIEQSECYLTLIKELGPEAANRWTETIRVPLGKELDG